MRIPHSREKLITKTEKVLQPLPHKDFPFANPFIVLHHLLPQNIKPGQELRIHPHPHPHRGFAPVTFQLQREGYHKDNAGNDGIIKAGDVQWMFVGKGIMHSEGPSENILQNGGVQELLQLWVNVPKANKWEGPAYQSATREQQPQVMEQQGVHFRLASGKYEGKTGPLKTITPVILMTGTIEKGKREQFVATPGFWTLLYVVKGIINVNQETLNQHNLVVFEKEQFKTVYWKIIKPPTGFKCKQGNNLLI